MTRTFTAAEMEGAVRDAALEARHRAEGYKGYPIRQLRHIDDAEVLEAAADALRQAAAGPSRCGTCRHFATGRNVNNSPIGICRRNHSFGWSADGSGFCHLHEAKP